MEDQRDGLIAAQEAWERHRDEECKGVIKKGERVSGEEYCGDLIPPRHIVCETGQKLYDDLQAALQWVPA